MKRYRMSVIAQSPAGSEVLRRETRGPFFHGGGDRDYSCGTCDQTLLRKVDPQNFEHLIFRCRCGTLNRIPLAHQAN